MVQFQQANAANAANEMEIDESALYDWEGLLHLNRPTPAKLSPVSNQQLREYITVSSSNQLSQHASMFIC